MNLPRKWAVLALILSCFISNYGSAQLFQQTPQAVNDAVGVCATYTFRLQTGNGSYENHINDVSVYANSGVMYHVGYTTINGDRDALLQMSDRTGQIIWSKTLGVPGRTEVIEAVSLARNGNVVMTGTLEQAGAQKPFIITAAPDGTVLWMKLIATPTSYRGKGVVATRLDGIGFAAEDDSTVIYGNIDYNGNLQYLKRLRLLQSSRVLGIVNHINREFTIAFTGTDTGRKVGGFVLVRTTYNDVWVRKLGGVAQNKDFIFHKMQMLNLRPRVTGIYSVNNGPYKLFRVVFNAILQGFETFTTPGITFDETASSALTSWVDVVAFSPSASSTDLYTVRAYNHWELGTGVDTPIYWANRFTGLPNYKLADAERTFDAGTVFMLNLSGHNKVQMIKVDSAGLSPGCAGVQFPVTKVTDNNSQGDWMEVFPTTLNLPLQSEALTQLPVVIDTSFQCRQLSCPPAPIEDTCLLSYYRVFKSNGFVDYGTSLSVGQNKDILVTGYTYDKAEPASTRAIFVQFDSVARLLNRKAITSNQETWLYEHLIMKDGNILTLGSIVVNDTTSYMSISKFSPALSLIWNRSFTRNGGGLGQYQAHILESADGSIFLSYHEGHLLQQDMALLKLNANGNLLWVKNYRPFPQGGPFGPLHSSGPIAQDDQYIYTAALIYQPVGGTLLMKTEKSTGNVVWAKHIHHGSLLVQLSRNLMLLNDKLVLYGNVMNNNHTSPRTALVMMDKNGNFVRSRTFTLANTDVFSRATGMSNNDVVLTGYWLDNTVTGYGYMSMFVRLDTALQVRYSKRSYDVARGAPLDVKEAPDGSIYEAGSVWFRDNGFTTSMFLRKRLYDGTLGNCFNDSLVITPGTVDPIVSNVNFTPTNGSATFTQFSYTDGEYTLQQNHIRCASPVECIQLKVVGPQNICRDTTYLYNIQRNAGCNATANWSFSGAQVQVVAVSDSMVRIKFLSNGNAYVKARLFTGCRWLEDSLQVQVSVTPDSLNLGVDGGICPGNTRVLRAGPHFKTYVWQDGSTDSVFTVTQPGTYHVTTTNGCGDLFSDTVIINNSPAIPFDLGADLSKCNNDSLTITAPAGFMNYQWSPDYNISSTTGQSVTVFPATNTMYKVAAEKSPGCFAYDSINITVNLSLPVDLGVDTSFCAGDSVVLYAGSGFAQYQWSTGSTSDHITVKNKGRYFVVATGANLCRSYDTLEVLNVFANPVVNLSRDSLLCMGDSRTLNAGAGFLQYAWHDGSASPSITVSAPGKYWVTVRDGNNCYGSDTTAVTRLLPLPGNFLPADTTLCTYSKFTIIPSGSFSTYAWSTGAFSSNITIDKAGVYTLQVEDNFGCKGTDEIVIAPKDCLKGIFFPNAFTPNRDRKNDAFKPQVYGVMVSFRLTIYNRWGGRVYETREWQNGWDGTIAGVQQQSDAYVWVCTYQFLNEPAKTEKGLVVLIR